MTKKVFIPKRGDTVRVRLRTGEAVDAVYDELYDHGCFVKIGSIPFLALSAYHAKIRGNIKNYCSHECRFIGPSCDLQEIAK